MKVILLTGSAGSIGSKIVEYLSKKNKIICVDKNLKELIKLKKGLKKLIFINVNYIKRMK